MAPLAVVLVATCTVNVVNVIISQLSNDCGRLCKSIYGYVFQVIPCSLLMGDERFGG